MQGRKRRKEGQEFRSLEVRGKLIALKKLENLGIKERKTAYEIF